MTYFAGVMSQAGGTLRFGRPKAFEQAQAQLQTKNAGTNEQVPTKPLLLEAPETTTLRLTNMLSEEMVRDDEEYADVKEDIEEELKAYGTVCGVEIPRSGAGFLCAFVKFSTAAQAKAAKKVLEQRTFSGKKVGAEFFSPEKFDKKVFGLV